MDTGHRLVPCCPVLGGWHPAEPSLSGQAGWLQTCPPTLASAASPEAGSGCPMFDFVDPISKGSRRVVQRARSMPFSSWGSPTCAGQEENQDPAPVPLGVGHGAWGVGGALTLVPVPWASIYSRDSGASPAGSYRERMSCSCASPEGKVTPVGGARPQPNQ